VDRRAKKGMQRLRDGKGCRSLRRERKMHEKRLRGKGIEEEVADGEASETEGERQRTLPFYLIFIDIQSTLPIHGSS